MATQESDKQDVFQFLTEEDRKRLFEGAPRETLQRGQYLFREGEYQPNLYLLRSGHVRVERLYRERTTQEGGQPRNLTVARYGPGDVIGEISFIQKSRALGSVVAEEDVEVTKLDGNHIDRLMVEDAFAARFYRSLAVCLGSRLVQIVPGMKLHDALKAAGPRPYRSRSGQLSERQLPGELTQTVDRFRSDLHAIAAEPDDDWDPARAQPRVNQACDALLEALNRFTSGDALVEIGMNDPLSFRDVPELARGIGGYVFRETFSILMQSATIAAGFDRRRGRAEGRDFLERIERDDPEGEGRLGPLLDHWFLGRPLCESRRKSVKRMTALLQQAVAAAPAPAPARVSSLAVGTCSEIFPLLRPQAQPIYATCLDADPDDLLAAEDDAADAHCADRVTFLQADLLDVVEKLGVVSLGTQNVIYGLGVCDYFNDEQVKVLLDWIHGLLTPGGWVILTNRDPANPDRAFVEHILDWPVIHRTRADFTKLFEQSKFGANVEIGPEETGVTLFARCRK